MPHKSYVAASVPEKWEAFQISSSSNQFENPFKSAINIFKSFLFLFRTLFVLPLLDAKIIIVCVRKVTIIAMRVP